MGAMPMSPYGPQTKNNLKVLVPFAPQDCAKLRRFEQVSLQGHADGGGSGCAPSAAPI
jgi:hypothetical protein